jgi:hypothetical protein
MSLPTKEIHHPQKILDAKGKVARSVQTALPALCGKFLNRPLGNVQENRLGAFSEA